MQTAPHLCRPIEFLFPGVSRREPGLATLGVGIALYNALALWRPPAARPQAVRPRALRAGAHLRSRRPRRRAWPTSTARPTTPAWCSRTSSTRRPPAPPSPTTCAPTTPLRDRRGRVTRRRARGQRERRSGSKRAPRVVLSATGPFTDSFLAERLATACARRSACTWCSTPPASPTAAARWCCARPATTGCSSSCPPARAPIVGHDRHGLAVAASRRASTTTSARAAKTSPTCSRRPTTRFPTCASAADDVLSTFAALRPLLATSAHTPSETSREHEIARAANGLLVDRGRQADDPAPDGRRGRRPLRSRRCTRPASNARSIAASPAIARCPAAARPARVAGGRQAWPPT